jgi:hypothetical protein
MDYGMFYGFFDDRSIQNSVDSFSSQIKKIFPQTQTRRGQFFIRYFSFLYRHLLYDHASWVRLRLRVCLPRHTVMITIMSI